MPEDELAFAVDVEDGRRRVARFLGGECLPDFLAGVLVKRDGDGSWPADEANQAIAVEDRMAGETPLRRFLGVILEQIARPEDRTLVGVVAVEMPHGAERVDLAASDERSGARA